MTSPNPVDQSFRRLLAGLDAPVEPPHDLATRLRLRVLAEAELDAPAGPRPVAPPVAVPAAAPGLGVLDRPAPTAVEPVSITGPLPEPAVPARPAPRPVAGGLPGRRRQPWWLVALEAAAGLLLLLGAAVVLIRLSVEGDRPAPRLGSAITAVAAPTGEPALLWEREDPDLTGVSDFVFGDDTVVRMVQDEHKTGFLWWERYEYESFLQSLDRRTGALNWQIPVADFGQTYVTEAAVLFVNYPTSEGGAVSLVALDPADGSERWRTELPQSLAFGPELPVVDDVAFLATFDGHVRAIDLADGSAVWTTKIGEPPSGSEASYLTGSSLTLDGDRLLAFDATGGVVELDASTGAIVATHPPAVVLPRFAYEGRLYVTADHLVTMVSGTDQEFQDNVAPPSFIRIAATDRTTGEAAWSTELVGSTSSLSRAGDHLLLAIYEDPELYDSSTIRVLDLASGAEVWTRPQTAGFKLVAYARSTTADGQFLYGTQAGEVVAVDLATGAERWRLKVGDHLMIPPVVSGGIALTSDRPDRLVAISIPENRP